MPRAERDLEHLLRPATAGVGLEVAATEPDAAQLVWAHLPEGRHELLVAGRQIALEHPGGPGSVVVDDLTSDTDYRAELRSTTGVAGSRTFRTPVPPRGERLFRFATISDLHLGRGSHHAPRNAVGVTVARQGEDRSARGSAGPLVTDELEPTADRAFRCAAGRPGRGRRVGCPAARGQGRHLRGDLRADLGPRRRAAGRPAGAGHDRAGQPRHRHVAPLRARARRRGARASTSSGASATATSPGCASSLVDSTIPDSGWGDVARHADEVAALARDARGGVFVATHHQPQRFAVPLYWPHGIPGPDARRFARTVRRSEPIRARLVRAHPPQPTPACRRPGLDRGRGHEPLPRRLGGLHGARGRGHQTVRRITEPDTLVWSERSRRMLRGVWALWAAGELTDRCFTLVTGDRRRAPGRSSRPRRAARCRRP